MAHSREKLMNARVSVFCVVALLASTAAAAGAKKGLYAEEDAKVTAGDLHDQDYWWAKFDAMMLEEAIRTRQPEGHIAMDLVSSLRRLESLSRKFPDHADIQKWKARAQEINEKIDEDKDRHTPYKPGFIWNESNFAQAWVNWHWAQVANKQNDAQQAKGLLTNVIQNLELLSKPGRMANYTDENRTWVEETLPKAKKLHAELAKKTL